MPPTEAIEGAGTARIGLAQMMGLCTSPLVLPRRRVAAGRGGVLLGSTLIAWEGPCTREKREGPGCANMK